MDFHPDGGLIFGQLDIFRIGPTLPGFTAQQQILPSEDGSLLYVFDNSGRHTETRNALTNAIVFAFAYDATGQLESVTDGDGDATTIQRDPVTGNPYPSPRRTGKSPRSRSMPTAIIATVANPNSETFQMGYDAKGLMTAFTRPKALTDPDPLANYTTTVTYDALGLMDRDTGADNGFLQTVRTEDDDGYTVSATTAEGRLSTFRIEEDAAGSTIRTNTDPVGTGHRHHRVVQRQRSDHHAGRHPDHGDQSARSAFRDAGAPVGPHGQTPGGLVSTITPSRTDELTSMRRATVLCRRILEH